MVPVLQPYINKFNQRRDSIDSENLAGGRLLESKYPSFSTQHL
jgi:hypothetical protein